MQRRDLMTLVMAIGGGLLAFMVVVGFLRKNEMAGERFVAAAVDIPADTMLTPDMVILAEPTPGVDPTLHFLQIADVLNCRTLEAVTKGARIERSKVKVIASSDEADAIAQIPEGMRAVTIPAASVSPLPDILLVGAYVDIIGKISGGYLTEELRTLYRGAKIISVKRDDQKTVTSLALAMDTLGAEVITRALVRDKIGLVLRSETEVESSLGEGIEALLSSQGTEEGAAAPVEFNYTEIIRGVTKESVPHSVKEGTPSASNTNENTRAQGARSGVIAR